MDYTTQSLGTKLRKGLRYTRLYGPRRTLIKIKGQYHMKHRFDPLPAQPDRAPRGGHVGILGCGNFAFSNIAYYVRQDRGSVIRGVMDVDVHRAASLARVYGARFYTDDAGRVIHDPEIDLVYIVSNHASHAEYAVEALEAGKAVHIEKPHVVSEDQLMRLCRAMVKSDGPVRLGFNRPTSRFCKRIQAFLDEAEGPAMLNWFVVGHEIPAGHWYTDDEEGGRVFGNLCHWTDLVYRMTPPEGRYPITITPIRGDRPDSDIVVTFTFADGTIAAIEFTAKGHSFEGVRETFSAQRGDVVISMRDFTSLTIDVVARKHRYRTFFRDQGHRSCVRESYDLVRPGPGRAEGSSVRYVWETGELFLRTKQALDDNVPVVVREFDEARLAGPVPTGDAAPSASRSRRGAE